MDRATHPESGVVIPADIAGLHSDSWKPTLIRQFIEETAEGPLFDRKTEMRIIHCKADQILNADEDLRNNIKEFIKDTLSLLNAARRVGKRAYMVFGVKDDWKIVDRGVIGQSTRNFTWDEYSQYLQSVQNFQRLHRDLIEREDFRPHAERLIDVNPSDAIHYEFGWLEHNGKQYFLSYLEFEPRQTPRAFVVKQPKRRDQIWTKQLGLHPGETWTRNGADKAHYDPGDVPLLTSWSDMPFITAHEWQEYAKSLLERINSLRNERRRHVEEVGLQDISVYDSKSNSTVRLNDVLEQFCSAMNGPATAEHTENVLFLVGQGGTGKSTSAQLLIEDLARRLKREASGLSKYEQISETVPVYVEMRGFRHSVENALEFIISTLRGVECNPPENLRILSDRLIKWIIVLDAVDEVSTDERAPCIDAIGKLLRDFPHAKFIVVTRPHIFPDNVLHQYRCVYVQPFKLGQIIARVQAEDASDAVKGELIALIRNEPEVQQLLSVPRMLDSCLVSLTQNVHPTVGTIFEAAVEEFLQHELGKSSSPAERRKFRSQLVKLAEHMVSGSLHITSTISLIDDDFYNQLLSMGLLVDEGSTVRFASRYIGDYLLAKQMLDNPSSLDDFRRRITEHVEKHLGVVKILANLTNDDLSDFGSEIGCWVAELTDPLLVAQLYLQRLNPIVSDPFVYVDALEQLAQMVNDGNQGKVARILQEALADADFNIYAVTVEALKDYPSLWATIQLYELEIVLAEVDDPIRQNLLWDLIESRSGISNERRLHELLVESPINVDFILRAIDRLDWSSGDPAVLLAENILGAGVPGAIRQYVLQRILDMDSPLSGSMRATIENLVYERDREIAEISRRILGLEMDEMKPAEVSPPDEPIISSKLAELASAQLTQDLEDNHESGC